LQRFSLRSFLTLTRVTLSLAVTFSSFAAFVDYGSLINGSCFAAMAAIFCLSTGTSMLNQVQEYKVDALMERTKRRAIPTGAITPALALGLSILLLLSGLFLFVIQHRWIPLLLGIFNILLYNGIYTTLKMKSTFALIPGALTGAIPIFMGWTAAGGAILDTEVLYLGLFMFCWQIPHFWLLMLANEKDYHFAGIPVITDNFSSRQVRRMILVWLTAASATSIMMVTRDFSHHILLAGLIVLLNITLMGITIYSLFISRKDSYRLLFILVNGFMLMVLMLLVTEKLFFNN
jgi:protoheme IX farnesyltransferase